jgi:endonuclease YncB( thermonuclease family)
MSMIRMQSMDRPAIRPLRQARVRPLSVFGISLLAAAALLAGGAAMARERAVRATEAANEGVVRGVIDGDTLLLQSGVEVRLVGIQAPKLPLGRRGFRTWPLAAESRTALEGLTLRKHLTLSYGGREIDRNGRLLAQLTDDAGTWIQGAMLSRGMARVYTFADNRGRAAEMLALEREARAAKRGIWANAFYRVRTVDEAPELIDSFQLIEGRVLNVSVLRGRVYLNFGPDWRTDFTVTVAPGSVRRFERGAAGLRALAGARLRIRGWLQRYNGPMIEATHPEQIEDLP